MNNPISINLVSNGATEEQLIKALDDLMKNAKVAITNTITELKPNNDFDGEDLYCFEVDLCDI